MEQTSTSGQNSAAETGPSAKPRIQEIGNFEIISKLGQGGMGAVYKARQKSLDRIVALKVLPPSIAKNAQFTERFQREARASAKLNHAHIVQGIDVGQDPATKLWYFAMEFIDGPTLQQVLKKQGKLEEEKALKLVAEVASALECVASAGMVHRDIKPDNILIASNGAAKLADLGLAKEINDDASLTQSGHAVGTPNYMAPEQVRGELAQIDIRTDIYSLGATLFHLVTGQPPFSGETSAVIMAKHLTEAPPKAISVNPKVSSGCSKLIDRMLQKKREQRIQTPREVAAQIQKILAGEEAGKGMATGPREPVAKGGSTTGPRDPITRRSTTGPRDPVGLRGTTGPREPVGSSSSASTRFKPATKSSMKGLYAGGAVLAVALIAFIALRGGTGSKKAPNHESSGSSSSASNERKTSTQKEIAKVAVVSKAPAAKPAESPEQKQRRLEEMVSAAHGYEKSNPENFDEVLRRYDKALSAIEGSPVEQKLEPELQSAIKRVQERRNEMAEGAWSKMSAAADAAAREGDYDSAFKALAEIPKALTEILAEKASSRTAELRKEGESKLEPALQQAEQASAAADPAAGLKALEAIEKLQLSPLTARAKQLKTRLETEIANADELERKRGELVAGKKLEEYLSRFDAAIIEENAPQKARDAAAAASRDPVLKSVSAKVESMKDIVAAFDEVQRAQENALATLKGKPFTVGKDKGTIEKVEGGIIHVAISLGGGKLTATKKVPVKDLSDEQRNSLFHTEMPNSPGAKVGSAMLKLAKGREDLGGALALLDSAGDFALAGRYREIIRVRQVGVAEAAAEKAWPALAQAASKPCDTPEQGKVLLDAVDKYLKDHGQTQFVKGKETELAEFRKNATRTMVVNLARNGDFEKGLEGWKTENDMVRAVPQGIAGSKCVQLPRKGWVSQELTLDPGRYRLTLSCKGTQESVGIIRCGEQERQRTRITSKPNEQGWHQQALEFTLTESRCRLTAYSPDGEAHVDDIVLTALAADKSQVAQNGEVTQFNGHSYRLIRTPLSWTDARRKCEEMGGYLATISSVEENNVVLEMARAAKVEPWIGIADLGGNKWIWANGELSDFVSWNKGEPNAGAPRAARLATSNDIGWRDSVTKEPKPYICEWPTTTPPAK